MAQRQRRPSNCGNDNVVVLRIVARTDCAAEMDQQRSTARRAVRALRRPCKHSPVIEYQIHAFYMTTQVFPVFAKPFRTLRPSAIRATHQINRHRLRNAAHAVREERHAVRSDPAPPKCWTQRRTAIRARRSDPAPPKCWTQRRTAIQAHLIDRNRLRSAAHAIREEGHCRQTDADE